MARPKKQKVEYFPHFVASGRTIFILESEYGNDGYAFWFKLLEILGDSEGHYYDCSNNANWKFLLAKTHVDGVSAEKIINTLIDLGQIDEELWKDKVIWVQNFVNNLSEVYRKRTTPLPSKPLLHTETQVNNSFRGENSNNEEYNSTKTLQSKVKESKVKESKEKKNSSDSCCSNSDFNILAYAEERNFILSPIQIQQIQEDINIYSLSEVKEALTIADNNGKRTYSYVRGILQKRRAGEQQKKKADEEFEEMKKAAENGEDPF